MPVQRGVESGLFPVAGITSFGEPVWVDISQRHAQVMERVAAEAVTGFKSKSGRAIRSQARVGRRAKLVTEETPERPLPSGPLSEMGLLWQVDGSQLPSIPKSGDFARE